MIVGYYMKVMYQCIGKICGIILDNITAIISETLSFVVDYNIVLRRMNHRIFWG